MGMLREWFRRWQFARHAPAHWHARPNTIDRRIFRSVVIENEYRLPERFGPDDVVLDIGAHIGSFALACLRRGARRIVCCEPDEANYRLLCVHLAPYRDRVELHRAAVWRSDEPVSQLALHNPLDPRNTGAIRVGAGAQRVDAIAFDELLAPFDRVRLVKLDCEGAEWPILRTTRALERVEELCGEYHLGPFPEQYRIEADDTFAPEDLTRLLEAHGYLVERADAPGSCLPVGLFFARRPGPTGAGVALPGRARQGGVTGS